MFIELDTIAKVAHLAKLSIAPNEAEKLRGDLNRIMDFVDKMQKVETTDIEPVAHPFAYHQPLRADKTTEVNNRDALLANAPASKNGVFLVPLVIE